MGQKTNPIGLRLGINTNWKSRWFPGKSSRVANVGEDYKVRGFLKEKLYKAGVGDIIIERTIKKLKVTLVVAKPGAVIGKKGEEIEKLKNDVSKLVNNKEVILNIKEERRPQLSAQLAAENVGTQLENRVAFRRAMKKVMQAALKGGAKGIRIQVSGRLGGAEIARREWYLEGRVPLHTLRAKVDYGFAEAHTTYGVIGIKTWIFKGEVLSKGIQQEIDSSVEQRGDRGAREDRGEKKPRAPRRRKTEDKGE
ncbi:MAG: 30S ribosomal protein S3 [Helicobacteraceae bacterium]|jgi:small subunit ribosomal protein S3|nr:30S ribosomal protein S3 [Helicobacteraceae bacterium]